MRSWRKMTWAILIWTVLMLAWIASGVSATSNNCAGMAGDALTTCQAGTAIGGGLAVTFIFFIWFIGFIILSIIWFMSRPKNNVVIYGPQGQQMTVSEKEANKRVKSGWSYQPQSAPTPQVPPPPA